METSAAYDKQSKGEVEQVVQEVQAQARTMRLALESRIGRQVHPSGNYFPWLVKHASLLINIFRRGEDGRTAWERRKGRAFKRDIHEFGEQVLYPKPGSGGKDKFDARWESGVFLGMKEDR